jgi:hypothetical protein
MIPVLKLTHVEATNNKKFWKELICLLALHYLATHQRFYRYDIAQN